MGGRGNKVGVIPFENNYRIDMYRGKEEKGTRGRNALTLAFRKLFVMSICLFGHSR